MTSGGLQATDSFRLLCGILSCKGDSSDAERELRGLGGAEAYAGLLNVSYDYLLTPALYRGLERRDLIRVVPGDLADFLRQTYRLNVERNRRIKDQVNEVVSALGGRDIEVLPLKGAAHLFQADEVLSGERMLGDIDMLVDPGDVHEAVIALNKLGYVGDESLALKKRYHDVPLTHPDREALLELHIDFGPQRHLVPVANVFQQSIVTATNGDCVSVPCGTMQVFHNIFHAQIQDRNHEIGLTSLRQLHDLRMLCEIFDNRIAWAEVERLMVSGRYKGIMNHYLFQANRLLDLDVPPEYRNRFGARVHFFRCSLQRRLPLTTRVLRFFASITGEFYRCRLEHLQGRSLGRIELWVKRWSVLREELAKYKWGIFSRLRRDWNGP